MKQKLILFIALVLAITQGMAAEEQVNGSSGDRRIETFSASVGQQVTRTIDLTFKTEAAGPNDPVVRSSGESASSEMANTPIFTGDYSVSILGTDNQMFSASIVSFSISLNSTVNMSVRITYSPTADGAHAAILHVLDGDNKVWISCDLSGEATRLYGDVNGDGQVSIADLTTIIDNLLENSSNPAADINEDGIVSITDVSELIDMLLGVPITRTRTFLIITMTDGTSQELMIDENTRVKIAKPDLFIQTSGQTQTFSLDKVAHLSYDERLVTIGNMLKNINMTEEDRETIKTMRP